MIKFAILAVLLAVALIQQTGADTCSYNHCYKEELSSCKPSDGREHCNALGQIYVTYREGPFSLSKHKCCNMTVWELPRKSLYCVRNLRINELKCSSDNSDSYQIKIRTLGGCNKFTCE